LRVKTINKNNTRNRRRFCVSAKTHKNKIHNLPTLILNEENNMTNITKGIVGLAVVAGVAGFGALALPIAAYADTATVEVKLNLNSALTISNSGSSDVVLGTSTSAVNTGSNAFTVTTNNASGYKLSISGSVADGSLASATNSIPAVSATVTQVTASGGASVLGTGSSISAGTSAFGFNIVSDNTYFKVPNVATDIKTTDAPATGGDITTVYFGAGLSSSQASGNYSNLITMIAVGNS
jgi:hypothetical protein